MAGWAKHTKGLVNRIITQDPRNSSSSTAPEPTSPNHTKENPRPVIAFTGFIDEKCEQYKGRNGRGDTVPFVPYKELAQYWKSNSRIEGICKSYKPYLTNRYDSIRKRSLRIFSILVYLDAAQFLDAFLQNDISDEHLPFKTVPPQLAHPVYEKVFLGISDCQWMFCPLILDNSRLADLKLEPDHILPLFGEELIKKSGQSRVSKIRIYEDCIDLGKQRTPKDNVFVLKSYGIRGSNEQTLLKESKAMTTLQAGKNEHIVGYYGSFIQKGTFHEDGSVDQKGTFNLILQYVDGGSLLDFLRSASPPQTAEQVRQFWKSIFKLFQGLHYVHQLLLSPDDSLEYRGIHQDIKPDNILRSTGGSASPFDFSPMLADFGHSHFLVAPVGPGGDDVPGIDRHGNQTYCAPENSHHAKFTRESVNHITSHADIFSMGCVLSEGSVWVVSGPSGVEEYARLRFEETETMDRFKGTSQSGCFHDGVERLKSVNEAHERVRQSRLEDDFLTPAVLGLVEDCMLLERPEARSSARELHAKFDREYSLEVARARLSATVTSVSGMATKLAKAARTISTEGVSLASSPPAVKSPGSEGTLCSPSSPGPEAGLSPGKSPGLPPRPMISPIQQLRPLSAAEQPSGAGTRRHSEPPPPPHLQQPGGGAASVQSQRHSSLAVPTAELYSISAASSQTSLVSDGGGAGDNVVSFTIKEAGEWRQKWKEGERFDNDVHNMVRRLQYNLRGRHHLFFIDNSSSMGRYRDEVLEAFQSLAYVVKYRPRWNAAKGEEPARVELKLASSVADRPTKEDAGGGGAATTPLVDTLRSGSYNLIPGMMEDKFGWLVDNIIIPRLPLPPLSPSLLQLDQFEATALLQGQRRRGLSLQGQSSSSSSSKTKTAEAEQARRRRGPLSVIVFTDGLWGRSSVGVQGPIRTLVERMKELGVTRTQVMIQFVKFGEEEEGERNLRELVVFAKDLDCDIVDTQPIDGNVCDMLIGSLNQNRESGVA